MSFRNDLIASGFAAVTPSDTTPVCFIGILIGGAGNVSVTDSNNVTTTIAAVAGQTIMGSIIRVNSTSTTATTIVGLVP